MPKARRTRFSHEHAIAPVSLVQRQFSLPDGHSQRLVEASSSLPANEILEGMKDPKAFLSSKTPPDVDQAVKADRKRHFRVEQAPRPYSKSHAKRLKKKLKDNAVVGDLNPVKDALAELSTEQCDDPLVAVENSKIGQTTASAGPDARSNAQSGPHQKSKKSITQRQRAKVLSEESTRLTNILKHPEFRKNPFAAIRTHAKNTLALPSKAA